MSTFKYDELVQKALISVVKNVLSNVAANGLPGNHHFYVRFRTDHPCVTIPKFLKERHPEEIMIVIQYQFWDLCVREKDFSIDLSFNGIQEKLTIPFAALTAFVDPSVKFALQFTPSITDGGDEDFNEPVFGIASTEKSDNSEGKIISFDSFKKN